jgi:hypothetical protein
MITDAIGGLFLLAALATLLAVAIGVQSKGAKLLLDQRIANNEAQEVLAKLQEGGEAKVSDESANVSVERTGKHVGDKEWVEVKVVREGRHASIVGLAPATQPGSTP